MENGKKPAFQCSTEMSRMEIEEMGLSKREYFAGLAMQGILASPNFYDNDSGTSVTIQVTVSAVKYADELLKQLEL